MINRTDASHPDFLALVSLLDQELTERDGPEHTFYAQFNKTSTIRYVVLYYDKEKAVSCGAIRELEQGIMEVKRMYTLPEYRGRGIAAKVLVELEQWAAELSSHSCRLETGMKQPEAIRLYERSGYRKIPNYGQYAGVFNSVCYEKKLRLEEG